MHILTGVGPEVRAGRLAGILCPCPSLFSALQLNSGMVSFCSYVSFESVLSSWMISALKVYCNLIFCIILYFIFVCVYVYTDKICSKITEETVERMLEVFLKCLVPHTLSERNSFLFSWRYEHFLFPLISIWYYVWLQNRSKWLYYCYCFLISVNVVFCSYLP